MKRTRKSYEEEEFGEVIKDSFQTFLIPLPKKKMKKKKKIKHEEDVIQNEVVNYVFEKYPNALFSGCEAGIYVPHHSQQNRKKLLGCVKGRPDLMFWDKRGKFSGLAIEMKTPKTDIKRPSRYKPMPKKLTVKYVHETPNEEFPFAQWFWLEELKKRGWQVGVKHNVEEAIKFIDEYFHLDDSLRSPPPSSSFIQSNDVVYID